MTELERELLVRLARLASQGMGQRGSELIQMAERIIKDYEIKLIEDSLTEE